MGLLGKNWVILSNFSRVYINTYTQIYTHIHIYTYKHASMHINIYVYIYVFTCVRSYFVAEKNIAEFVQSLLVFKNLNPSSSASNLRKLFNSLFHGGYLCFESADIVMFFFCDVSQRVNGPAILLAASKGFPREAGDPNVGLCGGRRSRREGSTGVAYPPRLGNIIWQDKWFCERACVWVGVWVGIVYLCVVCMFPMQVFSFARGAGILGMD